jgi:MinD superfamily P-loop ATPase
LKIAITSGKGGAGKTFAAVCLADTIAKSQNICYIDCDVEAPNAHLFLKPERINSQDQTLSCIEGVDPEKCTYCGQCAKVCYFNAMVVGKKNAMAFPELCRWCGACQIVCPTNALLVGQRTIGTVYEGKFDNIDLHWATLQAGAGGMTVRLIEQIKEKARNSLTILDSPPGTSCAVVNTIRDADVVILVADPTRFGMHDLKLSVHLCRSMNIEPLVLVNRAGIGDIEALRNWCMTEKLPILAAIPDDRNIAELYSKGLLPTDHLDYLKQLFVQIAGKILALPAPSSKSKTHLKSTKPEILFFESNGWQTISKTENQSANPVEITVLSGKGGTGKTSLAACFTQLEKTVVADCDVDAADMHLLLEPKVIESDTFVGGRVMSINARQCSVCEKCIEVCEWNAISKNNGIVSIDPDKCEGCGTCVLVCLTKAIKITPTQDGKWYWSSTRCGNMSHATLEPGKENSGKLVTLVRKNASQKNNVTKDSIVILDGSPGTGCPVIASVGGAKAAVIVTEPTVSGLHDLKRILELTEHFKIPSGVVINKADINPKVTDEIIDFAEGLNVTILGQLPYDTVFIEAQQEGKTVLEFQPNSNLSKSITDIWNKVKLITGKNEQYTTNNKLSSAAGLT